jgi:hypothetical protein
MYKAVRFPYRVASHEMIAKLVKAGFLRPEQRHDSDAVASAIAQMKQILRGGGGDDGPVAA